MMVMVCAWWREGRGQVVKIRAPPYDAAPATSKKKKMYRAEGLGRRVVLCVVWALHVQVWLVETGRTSQLDIGFGDPWMLNSGGGQLRPMTLHLTHIGHDFYLCDCQRPEPEGDGSPWQQPRKHVPQRISLEAKKTRGIPAPSHCTRCPSPV